MQPELFVALIPFTAGVHSYNINEAITTLTEQVGAEVDVEVEVEVEVDVEVEVQSSQHPQLMLQQ